MGEGGVAEGGGQRGGYGDEDEWEEDGTGGEDGWRWAGRVRGRDVQVDVAC